MKPLNEVTDEQIKTVLEAIPGRGSWDHEAITITRKGDAVQIRVERMYEHLPLTFATLSTFSELFGTKNIDEIERYAHGGCETCDYGSSYGWTIAIRPEKE